MTRKEYKAILAYELYECKSLSFMQRMRIKYLQPNTNCMYMARKMWYFYTRGGLWKRVAKMLYLRIWHKYGCCIYANISVGKGFHIAHPVGIVMGRCSVGDNFILYQNTTIGVRHPGDEAKGLWPHIGARVTLCSGSQILGNITIADDSFIGANSLVIKDLSEAGTYVGSPVRRIST